MKAVIKGRSELKLSSLTREYTYDIVDDDGTLILGSEIIQARPSEVVILIQNLVAEYRAVFEEANDVEIGQEI